MLRLITTEMRHRFAQVVVNEYKFYIDFKGLIFFDDGGLFIYPNSIRDKKFIHNFYLHLEKNKMSVNPKHQFVSQFWGEVNFARCGIAPVIFNTLRDGKLEFSIEESVEFDPFKLTQDENGCIWHPFKLTKEGAIKGVFSNELITEFVNHTKHKDGKLTYQYKGRVFQIDNQPDND